MKDGTRKIGVVVAAVFASALGARCGAEEPAAETAPDAILVTATRMQRAPRDVGVSATVLTREQIQAMEAQDIGQVLRDTAGVQVTTYGSMGSASTIAIRGSSDNQVLVLVDGRPVNIPSQGIADLSMYPVDNIERIEVLRGPASVLYGANALAGVINIVTKSAPEKPFVDATASYGTFNTRIFRLEHGASSGILGYLVTASGNSSDGDRENSECDGYHFSGKANWDMGERSMLVLSSGHSRQDKGVPGPTDWASPNSSQDDEQSWVDLTCRLGFGKASDVTAKAFFNRYWQEYANPDLFIDDIAKNHTAGVDFQHTLNSGGAHTFVWGAVCQRDEAVIDDMNGVSRIGGKQRLTTAALFAQDEVSLSDSLVVTPGLRYDDQSEYGSEVSPKVSALCRLSDRTSLRASVGRGFRAPTVNDLYWRDEFSVGSADLKPEKSVGYDIGVEHEFAPGASARVSLFRSEVEDMITWADPDLDWVWQAYNIDKARLAGGEVEADVSFSSRVSGTLSYTYLDARDAGAEYHDKLLRYRPRHKGGCGLNYRSGRGFNAHLAAEYNGPVYSDRENTTKLDGYVLVDARVSQTVSKGVEIFVAGRNLLNEEYEAMQNYPMPGVSVTGGMQARF